MDSISHSITESMNDSMAGPVTIVTFGLPRILQEILIETFDTQKQVEWVGHFVSFSEFEDSNVLAEPHVVIVDELQEQGSAAMLYRYPHARVLCIKQLGKRCTLWQLVPRKQELGEISSDKLTSVISGLGV